MKDGRRAVDALKPENYFGVRGCAIREIKNPAVTLKCNPEERKKMQKKKSRGKCLMTCGDKRQFRLANVW